MFHVDLDHQYRICIKRTVRQSTETYIFFLFKSRINSDDKRDIVAHYCCDNMGKFMYGHSYINQDNVSSKIQSPLFLHDFEKLLNMIIAKIKN
jgi:hypothetical protein